MKKLRLSALLAAGLLSACTNGLLGDPDPPRVRYEASQSRYQPTEDVVAVLSNESEQELGYNLCTSELEKRTGGSWVRVPRAPAHVCVLILLRLEPGQSATYSEPAAALPGPGTYRLRTSIETPIAGRRLDVVTDPFTVVE